MFFFFSSDLILIWFSFSLNFCPLVSQNPNNKTVWSFSYFASFSWTSSLDRKKIIFYSHTLNFLIKDKLKCVPNLQMNSMVHIFTFRTVDIDALPSPFCLTLLSKRSSDTQLVVRFIISANVCHHTNVSCQQTGNNCFTLQDLEVMWSESRGHMITGQSHGWPGGRGASVIWASWS